MAPIEGDINYNSSIWFKRYKRYPFKAEDGQEITVGVGNRNHPSVVIKWDTQGSPHLVPYGFYSGPHQIETFDLEGNQLSEQRFDWNSTCPNGIKIKNGQELRVTGDGFKVKAKRT